MEALDDHALRARVRGHGYLVEGPGFMVWDEDPLEALAWGVTLHRARRAPAGPGDDPTYRCDVRHRG